ncbi:MAG: hypothetical protein IPJ65_27720 [Archangiaceae bacterium]|nr:hypothetical protein [Archangiaceae bacterium]
MSAVLTLVLAGPVFDAETPNPFLAQAKELYEQLDFEKCMQRIKQASQWKGSNVRELRDVELYGALCSLNLGQRAEAAERFKLALRIDEDLELPEFASPKAVKLFLYVKRKLRQPAEPPPLPDEDLPPDTPPALEKGARAEAKPKAEPEKPVEVTSNSVLARHTPSITLGVGTLVIGGLGVGLGVNARSLEAQAKASKFESDYLAMRSQAQGNAIAANIAFGVAAALALAALVMLLLNR